MPVVHDLDLVVRKGEVVGLIGPNGAGKTTALLTLAGALKPLDGTVFWLGKPTTTPLHRRARDGLSFVPAERSVFMGLSGQQNLRLGRGMPERALDLVPELRPHINRKAGLLSGGQQQLLTLARGLASDPHLLMVDELSLGLAPLLIRRLMSTIRAAVSSRGLGVLLVEQHVHNALEVADRIYLLRRGRVVLAGSASELRGRQADIENEYIARDPTSEPSAPGADARAGEQADANH